MEGVPEKQLSNAAMKFKKNQNNAKRNLTARLGRKPTGAEILGLVKVRRQAMNEESFYDRVLQKEIEREAMKMEAAEAKKVGKKAPASEAKALLKEAVAAAKVEKALTRKVNAEAKKAAKEAEKAAEKAAKEAQKAAEKAAKEAEKALKKAEVNALKQQEKDAKKEARAVKQVEKEAVKALTKEAFEIEMERARTNLTRAIGKAPRVANIRRLAAIRKSGANLNVLNYLKVRNYTAKQKNRGNMKVENLANVAPPMDVCAACALKKMLEKED